MNEPESLLSVIEQEERRRAFWSIYLLDKLVSCGQSRPPAISDEDCHVRLPCDQQGFRDGFIEKTRTLYELANWTVGTEYASGTFSLTILAASALGRCVRHVLHQRETDEILPWDSKSEFASLTSVLLLVEYHLQSEESSIDRIINSYRRQDGTIDHETVGHALFAHTVFHLCHCLLNHPFLLRLRLQRIKCRIPPSFWTQTLRTSREHSCRLVGLLDMAAGVGCHVQSSFYAYSVAVAGSILSLCIHADEEISREGDSDLIRGSQQALNTLETMGHVWEHATKIVPSTLPCYLCVC
jgi:hypothetical protein